MELPGDDHFPFLGTHQVVRSNLARFRGREIKTTGDGFLATFDRPARAIRSADAIRAELAEHGLAVRIGLHTGECELLGDDIGGIAVHIPARVLAQAGPGEILCSRTVKDLVAGVGFAFTDRGTHKPRTSRATSARNGRRRAEICRTEIGYGETASSRPSPPPPATPGRCAPSGRRAAPTPSRWSCPATAWCAATGPSASRPVAGGAEVKRALLALEAAA